MSTRRCVRCGHPEADHVSLCYVLRAWVAHRLAGAGDRLDRVLARIFHYHR